MHVFIYVLFIYIHLCSCFLLSRYKTICIVTINNGNKCTNTFVKLQVFYGLTEVALKVVL